MKYLICSYIEKLHRYCFDTLYQQDYKITKKDWCTLRALDICFIIIPDYRGYLYTKSKEDRIKYERYR